MVEFQEEYRVPTPEEAAWLKAQGLPEVGAGSMIPPGAPSVPTPTIPLDGFGATAAADDAEEDGGFLAKVPGWVKGLALLAAGAGALYAGQRWVLPWVTNQGEEPETVEEALPNPSRRRRRRSNPRRRRRAPATDDVDVADDDVEE